MIGMRMGCGVYVCMYVWILGMGKGVRMCIINEFGE